MTLTRPQTRAAMYQRGLGLGAAGTADSVAVDGVTDISLLQDSNKGPNRYRGLYMYRANRAADDRVKKAGVLSGAKLFHTGTNYADTADLAYELVGLINPDELNDCIRRAQRLVLFKTRRPVSIWDDGDMSDSGTTSWTPAGANKAKIAAPIHSGFLALQATNTLANGYLEGAPKWVTAGEQLFHGAISRVDGPGTAVYQLVNQATGGVIREMTHTDTDWQHLHAVDKIPAGCEIVVPRLGARENGAVTVWDCLPAHLLSDNNPPAPSWLDQPWKLIQLSTGTYDRSFGPDRDLAASRRYEGWSRTEGDIEGNEPESTAARFVFARENGLPETDIWIYGQRPFSDRATMENETDLTYAPEELFIPAVEHEIAAICKVRYSKDPKWQKLFDDTDAMLLAQRAARPPVPPAPKQETVFYGGRI